MSDTTTTEPIYYNSLYTHGVDDKRRVQIPAKWRSDNNLGQFTLILWPKGTNPSACLLVLPPVLWKSLVDKLQSMPFSDPEAEALRRIIGRKSDRVALDKGGRICLPEAFARAAKIETEALLVGLVDRFEIWNPKLYEEAYAADEQLSVSAFKLI